MILTLSYDFEIVTDLWMAHRLTAIEEVNNCVPTDNNKFMISTAGASARYFSVLCSIVMTLWLIQLNNLIVISILRGYLSEVCVFNSTDGHDNLHILVCQCTHVTIQDSLYIKNCSKLMLECTPYLS